MRVRRDLVLAYIRENPGCTRRQITSATRMDLTAVAKITSGLVEEGIVETHKERTDSRSSPRAYAYRIVEVGL